MISRIHNRSLGRLTRISVLGSASVLAMLAAPAGAQQATPGSPRCLRTGNVVTCTGDIRDGFRSQDDATMRELRFRDLTQPITGVVEMRSQNDLVVDLEQGVALSPTNPRGSLRSDISLERNASALSMIFNPSRRSTLTFRGAADIDATFTSAPDTTFGGAILIDGARTVDFTNSGRLSVSATSSGLDIVEIVRADQVTIANSGALSFTGGSGVSGSGFTVTARDISITNSGAIELTRGSAFNLTADDYVNARTPARIVINNTADIRTQDASFETGTRLPPRSRLRMYDMSGTISVTNSGAWTNAPMHVETENESPTQTIGVTIENEGALTRSSINAVIDNFQYRTVDNIDINPRLFEQGTFSLTNRGALTDSQLFLSAEARNTSVTLVNSGNSVDATPLNLRGATLFARAEGAMSGNTTLQITNSGDLVIAGQPGEFANSGSLIYGESSHDLDLLNTGALSTQGTPNVTGIEVRQGAHIWSPGPGDDREEYVFDAAAMITNQGAISLGNVSGSSTGLVVHRAYGDIELTNSGAVAVATHGAGNFDGAGISLQGYSGIQVTNSGAVDLTGSGVGVAATISFNELSFSERVAGFQAGRLRGYDRAADLASRVTISTTGDVTAAGPGDYGIFGIIGVVDDVANRYYDDEDLNSSVVDDEFTASNDRASALIQVGSGATVGGGTGLGSAIGVQGVGSVTVTNAGAVLGRGDAETGAILLGDLVAMNEFDEPLPARTSGLFLNLVDSVNGGTIRSDAGYGIWAQNGAITNLVNRGLILGGQGSVRAARTSTIFNEGAGILEGRVTLEGAGSRLTNDGTIRTSGAGFVTHQINGDFIQTATGTLILHSGSGGRDRMSVAGNFMLGGNLNLALGAPSDEAIITVGGNLTLDGTLNVTDAGGFGSGAYRLFDYAGTLTDEGLELGPLPGGAKGNIQTVFANQVNLVVGSSLQFWDGSDTTADLTIDGGSGTWNNSATNWTRAAGDVNEAWAGNFAVFQGAAGTVTIDPTGITADGLQFAVSGYELTGGPLTLDAPATVRVGDGSAGGSAYTATIASAINGTGGLNKTDLGTLILSGAKTYTGGTTFSSGVLQVGADTALGASSGALTLDGGTLRTSAAFTSARTLVAGAGGGTLDTQANALTLSGPVQGAGALTKSGSGTLTLSGASSAYAGKLTVGAGALRLDGTLGGTIEIGSGATLSGTGTTGNLIVAGLFSPGNSIGTLTATGNAIFRSGSTFAVELTAAGTTDRLDVGGTATIEGGTVAITALDPGINYTDESTYTFLNATGGRTGTFAGITESSAFLDFALGYTANSAFITVDVIKTFPEVANTFNQVQAAMGLRELDSTAGSDSLAAYNAVLLLDEAPARAAFDASSGEIYPVLMAASLRRAEMAGARLAARGWEGSDEGLALWGGAEGHDGSIRSDGNGAAYSVDGRGLVLGADYRGAGFAIGVGGGWSNGDVELPGRASSARTDSWHLGLHASVGTGNSGFSAAASAVRMKSDADVSRTIAFGTIARTATSNADIKSIAVTAELRYGAALGGGWAAGPVLSASWSKVKLDAFAETGANALGLSGDGSSDDWSSYAAGAFLNLTGARGRIEASVQYLHGNGRAVEASGLSLAGAPASPFRVRAAAGGEDAALVRVGGRYELGGGWSVGGNLRAIRGSGERSVSGAGTISFRF